MKTKFKIGIAIGLAAFITTIQFTGKASPPRAKTQIVWLQAQALYSQTSSDGHPEDTTYKWAGVRIYNTDISSGAPALVELPTFKQFGFEQFSTNGLAETIAQYIDRGFDVLSSSPDGLIITLIKR